ncbi:MAG: hypothetical protein JRH20_26440, partial [Deltaproteobacteria bacterium]|nr:hypothetical protein [Deltaproteobacteria bacterium]
ENPEWRYQAMQLSLELGDHARAQAHLAQMPAHNAASPAGYRGAQPADDPLQDDAGFCCPCGAAQSYSSIVDCAAGCGADLGCFTHICAYTAQCQGGGLPFSLQLKLCIPPVGAQICFSFDTSGNLGVHLGASLFNGFFGVSAGLQFNTISGRVNVVADAGLAKLPINMGTSLSVDLSSGKLEGAVGLSDKSGAFTGQVTLLSK